MTTSVREEVSQHDIDERIDLPLSAALKEYTAQAHSNAEGSAFMTTLLEGGADQNAVVDLTAQLWFVYTALEQAGRAARRAELSSGILDPRLERRVALESDLAAMLGADWADKIQILPATARYMTRLAEIARPECAHLVIAHHYVRYLGDISGGQVISRRMESLYGISSEALSFYDFSAIGAIPPYRTRYRQALDSLKLSESQRDEMLAEAALAFRYNSDIFGELATR